MNWIKLEYVIYLAEEEDTIEEESAVDHFLWCLPKILKKNKNNVEIQNNDGYHDVGTDFFVHCTTGSGSYSTWLDGLGTAR